MSSTKAGAVIHRNLAVIACDSPGTLRETLMRLEDLDLDAVTIGDRHLLLPASRVATVLDRLKEHGQFPRLVGEMPSDVGEETVVEATDEGEVG